MAGHSSACLYTFVPVGTIFNTMHIKCEHFQQEELGRIINGLSVKKGKFFKLYWVHCTCRHVETLSAEHAFVFEGSVWILGFLWLLNETKS